MRTGDSENTQTIAHNPNADHLAGFNDPLAEKIDWQPLDEAGGNFSQYRLVQTDDYRLEGKATFESLLISWGAMLVGLLVTIVGITQRFQQHNLLAALIGLSFWVAGAFFIYHFSAPLVFDKKSARFVNGRTLQEGVNTCSLFRVQAVQVLHNPHKGSDGDIIDLYQLNLVCDDASRLHVSDYFSRDNIERNARLLAAFLQVPLWDDSGLLEQRDVGLNELHQKEAEPTPFPWFMLVVPNLILLAGVLWAHWDVAQVIWMVFVEAVAIAVVALLRAALTQAWEDFLAGLFGVFFMSLFIAIPAVGVYMVLHSAHAGGDFDHMAKLPFPEVSWFAPMFGVLLLARLLEMGWEYFQLRHLRPGQADKRIAHTGVWVFMVAWLGMMLSTWFGTAGLSFVVAIVLLRVVVTLAGYVIARWRKIGFV